MSVDVHAHFWTDAYLDKIAALGKTDTAAQRGRGAGDGAELDARLALTAWCSAPTSRTRPELSSNAPSATSRPAAWRPATPTACSQ